MAFHTKEFDVYLVLTGASAPCPWSTQAWLDIADALTPGMTSARGKAAVRCVQIDKASRKKAAFGKLGWDPASHRKWTHETHGDAPWFFVGSETWAPSWTQCEKDREAPDCYVSVTPSTAVTHDGPQQFGGKLLVALAAATPEDVKTRLRAGIVDIARRLDSPLTVYQRRSWGKGSFGGFTGALNDLSITGLFKTGNPHARPLDLATLEETWSPVTR